MKVCAWTLSRAAKTPYENYEIRTTPLGRSVWPSHWGRHPGFAGTHRQVDGHSLSGWMYPGSKLLGSATGEAGGSRPVTTANPADKVTECCVKMTAILTTADPVDKVAEFYGRKLAADQASGPPADAAVAEPWLGRPVSVQDDSEGRPVAIRVIVVHEAQASTTLVISRARGEAETHISWSHFVRVNVKL